jgi:hypothetical protein
MKKRQTPLRSCNYGVSVEERTIDRHISDGLFTQIQANVTHIAEKPRGMQNNSREREVNRMRLMHSLVWISFFALFCAAQNREGPTDVPPPNPPSIDQLEQLAHQPPPQVRRIDIAKIRREADELAKLAAGVPPDVTRLQNGLLPKDVINNLKRIEKLSKELRRELAQ